jgi:hypothetical protein
MPTIKYQILDKTLDMNYPWGREPRSGSPIVRGERRLMVGPKLALFDEIHSDGAVTIATLCLSERIYLGWILSQLAALLVTIDKMREVGGFPDAEYAIQMVTKTHGHTLKLMGGDGYFDDEYRFETGDQKFPTYSYSPRSEQAMLVNEMAQDILHAVGCRIELALNAEILG